MKERQMKEIDMGIITERIFSIVVSTLVAKNDPDFLIFSAKKSKNSPQLWQILIKLIIIIDFNLNLIGDFLILLHLEEGFTANSEMGLVFKRLLNCCFVSKFSIISDLSNSILKKH